jgi:hypothetical protein
MRRIIYTTPAGDLHIVTPNARDKLAADLTEAEIERLAWETLQRELRDPSSFAFGGTGVRWVEEADLPRDRSQREAWVDIGTAVTVDPAKVAPPQPITVSRLRFKLELADRGLLAQVEAAVAAAGTLPGIYWAEATEFVSDHALVLSIGAALELSPAEIRALFEAAAARVV